MKLEIECDDVNVDTRHNDNQVKLEINNPSFGFIKELDNSDIVSNCDDASELFEAIIENDDEILHNYLVKNGYIFNKA